MPTASTAQILRNNEAFEPFSQVIYMRSVLSGTFVMVNRHLVADLEAVGMWSPGNKLDFSKACGVTRFTCKVRKGSHLKANGDKRTSE